MVPRHGYFVDGLINVQDRPTIDQTSCAPACCTMMSREEGSHVF